MALKTPAFNDAKTYGFEWLRYATEVGRNSEGVVNYATDLVPTNAATGLKVDVAAGAALVKGDSGTPGVGLSQGHYLVVNDAAIANAVTLAAADATNPRLDQVVLKVTDSQDLGDASDVATLEVLTGTPTGGATLLNRSGAAALTQNRLRIADVLVPATATNLTAANVRDRRLPANGRASRYVATAEAVVSPGGALGTAALPTSDRVDLYVPANAVVELNALAFAKMTTTITGGAWAWFITDLATGTRTQLKALGNGGAPTNQSGGATGGLDAFYVAVKNLGTAVFGNGADTTEVTTGTILTNPNYVYGLPAGEYGFEPMYACGATATLTIKERRTWARVVAQGRSQ